MANHKSAIKRHRQNLNKRARNRLVKATLRTAVKKTRTSCEQQDGDSKSLLLQSQKLIASAAAKGVIHKRTAARQISRLTKAVSAAQKA